mmetsp:Transcript_61231/g.173925  ORF Transcript_61231/g.173925 Transcript_61231/m.173925 type:complete len:245 (+) Transcript_61231:111-845(+)
MLFFWKRSSSRISSSSSIFAMPRSASSRLPASSTLASACSAAAPPQCARPAPCCLSHSTSGSWGTCWPCPAPTRERPPSFCTLALVIQRSTSCAAAFTASCSLLSFTSCCCVCSLKLVVRVWITAQPRATPSAETPRRMLSGCFAAEAAACRRKAHSCLRWCTYCLDISVRKAASVLRWNSLKEPGNMRTRATRRAKSQTIVTSTTMVPQPPTMRFTQRLKSSTRRRMMRMMARTRLKIAGESL